MSGAAKPYIWCTHRPCSMDRIGSFHVVVGTHWYHSCPKGRDAELKQGNPAVKDGKRTNSSEVKSSGDRSEDFAGYGTAGPRSQSPGDVHKADKHVRSRTGE